jgi:hypothetical protein
MELTEQYRIHLDFLVCVTDADSTAMKFSGLQRNGIPKLLSY